MSQKSHRQKPESPASAGGAVNPVFRNAGAADKILGLERTTQRAVAAGYLTQEAARRWLDHLADGPFLAAVTFYIVVAEA